MGRWPSTFDYVGSGGSDLSAFGQERYSSLEGYARDVVEVCEELDLTSAVFVGHSVSAMVGVLAARMALLIMGNPERPELGEELTNSFCATDPDIAAIFARTTFLSDSREDLKSVTVPTLVLECSQDVIAPREVGAYVHAAIPSSRLVTLDATGHCPQLSAPQATNEAILTFSADFR
ncbi:alpha/beta fold hydrolase [Streptomyces sp. NPDC029674]|uniref:alpha/beta fold hydrolase n=1 Tax=Streptomyces sp. NPDC029674 TaxID=3365297 RepID=UPI00384CA9E8